MNKIVAPSRKRNRTRRASPHPGVPSWKTRQHGLMVRLGTGKATPLLYQHGVRHYRHLETAVSRRMAAFLNAWEGSTVPPLRCGTPPRCIATPPSGGMIHRGARGRVSAVAGSRRIHRRVVYIEPRDRTTTDTGERRKSGETRRSQEKKVHCTEWKGLGQRRRFAPLPASIVGHSRGAGA